MDARVVHAADGDDDGLAAELGHGESRHLEIAQHSVQRVHRLVGRDVDAGRRDVAIEDHVQVLIGRDAGQQLVGDRLVASLTGVAVRDAGGQLLEGHVDDRVEQALGEEVALLILAGAESARHLLDAQLLELERVDGAGDQKIITQRDAVPVLLGRPPVDPPAPRSVHPEVHRDLAVIRRQVVLGQQVLHHGGLRHLGELGLLGIPVLAAECVEVFPVRPGHVVVWVPVLAHREVAVDLRLDDGLELTDQL